MHFENKTFEQFKNVLSKEQHQHLLDVLTERAWSFDNWAEHEADKGILCWSMWGLETREFFNTVFFNRIQEITGRKYNYSRIYANGQSFGQDGVFHLDENDPNAHTFLYYATPLDPLEVYEYGGNAIHSRYWGNVSRISFHQYGCDFLRQYLAPWYGTKQMVKTITHLYCI